MTFSSESETSEAVELILPKVSSFPSSELGSKLKKVHTCDFSGCFAKFSRPWRLAAHKAFHLGQKPFPCDFEGCDKAYTSNYHLRRHKSAAHTNGVSQISIKCHYPGCNKEFKFIQNERKHFRRTHEEKICKICGEQFFKYVQLKKHTKIHTTGYLFECKQCMLKFQHKFLYKRHLRSHWLHACPVKNCSSAYQHWSNLRKHLATHPYEFVCAYCKKGYRRKQLLKSHILRHLNGLKRKPSELVKVTCSICEKDILGKASLRRHIRVVHDKVKLDKPERPKKPRAIRKDKGIPKKPLAVVLSDVVVTKEIERELIKSVPDTEYILLERIIPCT